MYKTMKQRESAFLTVASGIGLLSMLLAMCLLYLEFFYPEVREVRLRYSPGLVLRVPRITSFFAGALLSVQICITGAVVRWFVLRSGSASRNYSRILVGPIQTFWKLALLRASIVLSLVIMVIDATTLLAANVMPYFQTPFLQFVSIDYPELRSSSLLHPQFINGLIWGVEISAVIYLFRLYRRFKRVPGEVSPM